MMIDELLLGKLQKLAMIDLSQEEAAEVASNLNEILGFIDNLSSINTDDIALSTNAKTPLRDDVPKDSNVALNVLENAPKAQDGFFIVPKII
ncbi:Asp-tRNA(Asn)/Glu-tRNA(Gln) amidotransferase subunit GatC [Helicobacter canis]|uniref:Aspartyl/glutamyl-tRNA(Asn/Gln) amidotransferase subunit C n=1 Tax=Helicobacter canis TaxID=29419 RepID=A0A5M9QQR3_9HELI|nr:Asp-tRNA(Asn)/Glu-tRNA(Gln) amidotransferase subunit GatC [Helicobacter canis]KAA8710708.1 Asp-tRNA(Asn)/Glu-tRNA(Gln) amidotransferase subunit GatC [Helicobacter canis]